jgi:hypothetical protein
VSLEIQQCDARSLLVISKRGATKRKCITIWRPGGIKLVLLIAGNWLKVSAIPSDQKYLSHQFRAPTGTYCEQLPPICARNRVRELQWSDGQLDGVM